MARAAVLRRLTWQPAAVSEIRAETESASTLVFDVDDWPGHVAGQHVDVRLTAADGYQAQRSYSIASAGRPVRAPLEITVQRVEDGEVSPYLVDVARTGDLVEVRGPVGGYFTWEPGDGGPVVAIAGGSGIVPLMAMARTHDRARAAATAPPTANADPTATTGGDTNFRLVHAVRTPDDAIYAAELAEMPGIEVHYAYSRAVPEGWPERPGRLGGAALARLAPVAAAPRVYLCGPTGFVETVANLLVDAGHEAARIRTERFGPTGG